MTDQELREYLFDLYAANLTLCHPHVKDIFLCPFCFRTFGKDAVRNTVKDVSLAHCIQKSLGGRLKTLACAGCDTRAGREIDCHLKNRLETTDFFRGENPNSFRVWLRTADHKVRADIRMTKGVDGKPNTEIRFDASHSAPGQCEAMQNAMMHGDALKRPLKITQRGQMGFNMNLSRVAMLRAAYLFMFRQYGYPYVLHPNLHRLKLQFLNPRDSIIPGRPVVDFEPTAFTESTICFVPSLKAFLPVLVLRTKGRKKSVYGVFMPGLGDDGDSIYERVAEDQESNDHITINFNNVDEIKERLDSPGCLFLPWTIWSSFSGN